MALFVMDIREWFIFSIRFYYCWCRQEDCINILWRFLINLADRLTIIIIEINIVTAIQIQSGHSTNHGTLSASPNMDALYPNSSKIHISKLTTNHSKDEIKLYNIIR